RVWPARAGTAIDVLVAGIAPVAMPDPVVSGSCSVRVAAVCEPTLRRQAATARARVPPLWPLIGHRRSRRSDARHVRTPRCAVSPAFSTTIHALQLILHDCC